jgi:hypothetical protein
MRPPFNRDDFEERDIGVDTAKGRYGDVAIETCRHCGSLWLTYFVEYEGFSRSARWYRGLISPEVAQTVTAENAVSILDGLDWHFAGGSYFDSRGMRATGPVHVDL